MSMDICKSCDMPVDTDDDPECYVEVTQKSTGLKDYFCRCERCREHYAETEFESQS